MNRWQARIDPGAAPAVAASSSKNQLDLEKSRAKFKRFFKVPDDPVATFYGSYYRGGRQLVVGQISISENFFCFKSKFGVSGTQISVRDSRSAPTLSRKSFSHRLVYDAQFVVAFKDVKMIEKKSLVFGFINNAIKISTPSAEVQLIAPLCDLSLLISF